MTMPLGYWSRVFGGMDSVKTLWIVGGYLFDDRSFSCILVVLVVFFSHFLVHPGFRYIYFTMLFNHVFV